MENQQIKTAIELKYERNVDKGVIVELVEFVKVELHNFVKHSIRNFSNVNTVSWKVMQVIAASLKLAGKGKPLASATTVINLNVQILML